MSAILLAKAIYGRARSFEADLHAHLAHGYVFSTPELFVMGRPVCSVAPAWMLSNIACAFAKPDCWLIWSAAGVLAPLLALFPFPLPLVAFHRRRDPRLRVYQFERLRALGVGRREMTKPETRMTIVPGGRGAGEEPLYV